MSRQRAVTFNSAGKNLVGVLEESSNRHPTGVIFLHGWSGYRVGPHGMFVHAAREFAREGISSLRFDFRGRGDSDGDLGDASLISMVEDVRAAADYLTAQSPVEKILLLGICSGAEVAFGAATIHPAIAGLILWSAPIFWAEAAPQDVDVAKIEAQKKKQYAHEYTRKLLDPATWKKLVGGKLQVGMIARVLFGKRKSSLQVKAAVTPQEFRTRAIAKFSEFSGSVLGIYGTNDPTTSGALGWYQGLCGENAIPYAHHLVNGANHSYYSLAWESEVINRTLEWIQCEFSTSTMSHR